MPQAGSLLLVHLVEKRAESFQFARSRGEWPLHITLVPWFMVEDETDVLRALQSIATSTPPFKVKIGPRELFGTHNDVPVNIITDQTPVKELHNELVAALRQLNATFFEEHWMGDHYRAHITRHENQNRWRAEGEIEQINDFHMVRLLENDVCQIAQRFSLESSTS